MSKKFLSALLVGTALTLSTLAHASSTQVITGVDVSHNSWYAYLGGVTALSGQDIATQAGWLARLTGGYGQYRYGRTGLSSVDGDVVDGDLMIGYGMPITNGHVAAYLGGDWTNQNLSPNDPLNSVHGSEGGVKGQLELSVSPVEHVGLGAVGSYSTAFQTYWSRLHAGYNFGAFSIGPEVGFQGNKEYNNARYGAQISDIDLGFAQTSLHAGYVSSNRNGGDGGYGEINFAKRF